MGTTVTAIIIAALAGVGTYYSWNDNRGLSIGLAAVTLIAGIVGTIGAFFATVSLFFSLLPLLFVALGIWLLFKLLTRDNNDQGQTSPSQTPPSQTPPPANME